MGGKTQGQQVLRGSLKTHWMMYVNKVVLQVNPADAAGGGVANKMTSMLFRIDSKFVQPGFQFEKSMLKGCGYYDPSVMELHFCNGQMRKYYMGMTPWHLIMKEMKYINHIIEFERSMGGNEDELEDED